LLGEQILLPAPTFEAVQPKRFYLQGYFLESKILQEGSQEQ
jgi:hypothetical protein